MLSKPIGRLRLFLTKYIAGLLFVTLQVAVFTVCSFLVIGIRGGAWELSLFLAIPVVVLFFSYLFSICTLLGLLTRSTIASLLLTILFWFLIFAVSTTEFIFLDQRVGKEMAVLSGEEQVQVRLDRLEEARRTVEELTTDSEAQPALTPPVEHPEGAKAGEQQASGDAAAEAPVDTDLAEARERLERLQGQFESKQEQLERARKQERTWSRLHWYAYAGKTILPKTSETVELLNRVLVTTEEMEGFVDAQREQMPAPPTSDEIHVDAMDKQLELEKRIRARSLGWVIGTSLGFEFVILAFGGWIFCRRDF